MTTRCPTRFPTRSSVKARRRTAVAAEGVTATRRRTVAAFVVLGLLLLAAVITASSVGRIPLSPAAVLRTLAGHGTHREATILLHLRLPRIVIAILIGAGLGLSGAILQAVVRNVLADPGLLGINAGAGLFAAVFVSLSSASHDYAVLEPRLVLYLGLPMAALTGAGAAAAIVYTLARQQGVTPWRLVLVGIAVGQGLAALMITVLTGLSQTKAVYAKIWLAGSIWSANWTFVLIPLPIVLVLGALAWRKALVLDVLGLGDPLAVALGACVARERRVLLALAAGLAGACVAVGGTIGFLGLFAPHIARRLVGVHHARLLPGSALVGSLVMCVADLLGHNVLAPHDVPAGVVVASIGAPYFLFLLVRPRTAAEARR